jgi:transposase
LKYGTGVPFNHIEQLQAGMGIPVPSPTQWEIVEKAADNIYPVYNEFIRRADGGDIFHNDDTVMKILALVKENAIQQESVLKGMFTSGILSITTGLKIALFFTGRKHAGENLTDVLARRKANLLPPIRCATRCPETFRRNLN